MISDSFILRLSPYFILHVSVLRRLCLLRFFAARICDNNQSRVDGHFGNSLKQDKALELKKH